MQLQTLPFIYNNREGTPTSYNRLIVKSIPIPERIDATTGLVIPEQESRLCEIGTVISACEGSEIKAGDEVLFNKLDRSGEDQLDTVSIDGEVYDVVYENEIWSVNEEPFNQIFVRPISDAEITDAGLIITKDTKGFTQKGIVHLAHAKYNLKPGDHVEYRRLESAVYPQVNLNSILLDVLFERDIYLVNDKVAPYRIIVKIDLHAQHIKRTTADSGLLLSPLFIAMLYNLQYGEVMDIGTEAAKMYPELSVGNTAILHHCIESQPYRTVRYETGENGTPTYAYYIVNCWEEKSREMLGKLHFEKNTGKIIDIQPLNGNVFLKWNFELLSNSNKVSSDLLPADNDISKYKNLDDLRNVINQQKKEAAEKAKAKTSGIKLAISNTNKDLNKELWDQLDSEFRLMQREETAVAQWLRRDHLVVAKALYPRMVPTYVITPYEELYPINILGQKFIIAIPDYLFFKTHTDMNITSKDILPLGDNVLILPIEEEVKEGALLVPDSAKEKPVQGKVIAIGEHPLIKKDDVVLFRKQSGLEQEIHGVMHLILKQNDLLAICQ